MPDDDFFLCSQLIRVIAGRTVRIGNLEDIRTDRCTVTLEEPPPVGAQVTVRCIRCPQGKKSCTECRFRGRVRCHENDPTLGCLIHVDFEGRLWSPEEWHPQHQTNIRRLGGTTDA
jgi:hypothetical protein